MPQIKPISATVASNALTVGTNAMVLDFRSATLTSGIPISSVEAPALTLTVPSGATLGTLNATEARLALLILYNAGTPALGIVNLGGSVNLDETTLLSTSAISTAADSKDVVYTASAITNSPFRLAGYLVITEATAGLWATAPTLVQGYGGQAMLEEASRSGDGVYGEITVSSAGSTWTINAAVISQSKLKTSYGTVSTTSTAGANLTLPGGEYGFYPRLSTTTYSSITASIASTKACGGGYITNIYLTLHAGEESSPTAYARQRYVTSSGEVNWLFILRDKTSKKMVSMWFAPDHPCFGNGGKPAIVQHPFSDYDTDTQEIIVINPSAEQVSEIEALTVSGDNDPDLDILQIIEKYYEIDEDSSPEWPTKAITVGLPAGHDWTRMQDGVDVTPIKKVIPQPDYVITRSLKLKSL
jgi:hypothetical protein